MIDANAIRSTLSTWIASYDPATDAEINDLINATPISLSPSYLTLLRATNGGETFVGDADSDDAFDRRRSDDALFMLPAIGLADDAAILLAPSFAHVLLRLIGRSR